MLYIVIVNVLAILLAVLLDMKLKSTSWLRAAFFIPYILSLVIVGFIWKFIFMQGFESLGDSTGWGIFDLSWLGTPDWPSSPSWSSPSGNRSGSIWSSTLPVCNRCRTI